MKKKRVVITGLGSVNPLGHNVPEYWERLCKGENGIAKITLFDCSDFSSQIAGEVKDFDISSAMNPRDARRLDRFVQFAVFAAKEAVEDAQLEGQFEPKRCGVLIGSGIGGLQTLEEQSKTYLEKGPRRISPFFIPMMIGNMASGQVAILHNAQGPNYGLVSACASSNHAMGESFRMLQRGDADVMITGGAEATITPLAVGGFCKLQALSTRNDAPERASRPFDKDRDGFIIAEGGAVLILETLEHALARGAKIYAEIAGYGATCDAYHITAPREDGEGGAEAMRLAVQDAGLQPEDVDYVNAHGTSTGLNDPIETLAIKKAFGDHAYQMKISSNKSMTGHLLGAAGALEGIACCLSLKEGKIPPTRNLEEADAQCDLDYVPGEVQQQNITVAINNSLGFGGHNATTLFKKYTEDDS